MIFDFLSFSKSKVKPSEVCLYPLAWEIVDELLPSSLISLGIVTGMSVLVLSPSSKAPGCLCMLSGGGSNEDWVLG